MRQRVIKALAAFFLVVGGLAATAVAASATGEDESTFTVFDPVSSIIVTDDASGWE
jgi:hypothetical protein